MKTNDSSIVTNIANPIFFITNDVSKGLGLEKLLPNYHIVCLDDHPLVDYLIKDDVSVFCLERELGKRNTVFRNSGKVLEHPLTEKYIAKKTNGKTPWISFFKSSAKIDSLCQKRGYQKIGNDASLGKVFEDKIFFYQTCQQLGLTAPSGEIVDLQTIDFSVFKKKYGDKLVIQFGRGWAGSTTFFIKNEKELTALKKRVVSRVVKVTQFIQGRTILNNCCVTTKDGVLVSAPAEQINAIAGFTANQGGTCGRVWPARIDRKQFDEVEMMSKKVGEEMRKNHYRGWFGLDFLLEEETGKIYLSENNARLTASAPFYSKLEIGAGEMPLLVHHVLEFFREDYSRLRSNNKLTSNDKLSGSELVVRNDSEKPIVIRKKFPPGIYHFNEGKLEFVKKAYDVEGVENKGEFFITAAVKGRIVNPEAEMIRLNARENILSAENQPHQWMIKALLELKKSLMMGYKKVL